MKKELMVINDGQIFLEIKRRTRKVISEHAILAIKVY